jgi:Fur family transcriptional regulator, ferric uptake regulator
LKCPRRPTCCRNESTISRPSRAENIREAEGIFLQHLKRVGLKQTEQRNAILRTFLETREHLSIDELHRLVKKTDPRIGFTTVYRTLKLLAGCGLASEVAFHDGIARYEHQYNRRSHHHMVCTECGASVEFFSEKVGEIEQEIGRKHHYVTTRHTFQIYGVCEECRKKRRMDAELSSPENGVPESDASYTVKCPHCGTVMPASAAFCPGCGWSMTPLPPAERAVAAIAYFTFVAGRGDLVSAGLSQATALSAFMPGKAFCCGESFSF